jgi:hypothetical protein
MTVFYLQALDEFTRQYPSDNWTNLTDRLVYSNIFKRQAVPRASARSISLLAIKLAKPYCQLAKYTGHFFYVMQ